MANFDKTFRTLLLKTTVYTLVIGGISALLKYTGVLQGIHAQWYIILLFYFGITLAIFYFLLKSLQKAPRKFIFSFLGISLGRMLLFTAIILLYAVFIKTAAVSFILTFAAYYILFTLWEVILILPVVKSNPAVPSHSN